MSKHFRSCSLDQPFLLPPSLQDWLPEGHLARFIADVTNELDLSAIYAEYDRHDGRGLSAYHPLLLTRLLLYGYCTGMTSSRRIERATYDNVAFRFLAADQHPDHDTIANFRQQHLAALASLFVQALRLCQKAGLVKLGTVAIDGTKILANASTRRSLPYSRICERELYWKETVDRLLQEAQRTDQHENDSRTQAGDALPRELADAQSRLQKLRKAKAQLEQEAQQKLDALQRAAGSRKRGRPLKGNASTASTAAQNKAAKQLRRARRNAAQPTRQHNFVDPDSRVMRDNARKCFVQAYNAQVAADSHAQVIVAAEITQDTTDRHQLLPMFRAVTASTGAVPETIVADAGYWDSASLQDSLLTATETLVSPDAQPYLPDAPRPEHSPNNTAAQTMRERLASPSGQARYRLRKQTVEPVLGQIKEARGIRRFRLRGFQQVSGEWKLICATHNLLKLFRYRKPAPSSTNPGGFTSLIASFVLFLSLDYFRRIANQSRRFAE